MRFADPVGVGEQRAELIIEGFETLGILNAGDFFGEGCLTGQPLRLGSATALTDCSVMRIDKKAMVEVLHREHAFSDMFVAYLLTRNIRYELRLQPALTFQR